MNFLQHPTLYDFFFIEEYIFLITWIFKSLYFLIWGPLFDTSSLLQFSKFIDFIDSRWFLAKKLSNFVSLPRKLHNRYCHNDDESFTISLGRKMPFYTCWNRFVKKMLLFFSLQTNSYINEVSTKLHNPWEIPKLPDPNYWLLIA